MKERWRLSKEKLVSVEEGVKSTAPVTGERIRICDRLIQYVKLILYIELILLFGWAGYTLFHSNYLTSRDVESSTVPTEVLKSSALNDFKDTINKIETKEIDAPEENEFTTTMSSINAISNVVDDDFISDSLEMKNTSTSFEDNLEPKSDGDKEIMVKVPGIDANESTETESLENEPIIDWSFPFLWHNHKESDSFTVDSPELVHDSEFDDGFGEFYGIDKKDESNDVSEYRPTSAEKKTEQQNEKEKSSFKFEDYELEDNWRTRYELIKAIGRDPFMRTFRERVLMDSWENIKNDDKSSFWEESTKPSVVFPNESSEEGTSEKSIESEQLDTSDGNETESYSTLDSLIPQIMLQLTVPILEGKRYTDDFVEQITEASTATAKKEDNDWSIIENSSMQMDNVDFNSSAPDIIDDDYTFFMGSEWDNLSNVYDDIDTALPIDNVDVETANATTNEEIDGSFRDIIWETFLSKYHDFAKSSATESVEEEIKGIEVWPKLKDDRGLCSEQFLYGIKVIKCSWKPVDDDHSSDASSTAESKSDNTSESHDEILGKNYKFVDKSFRAETKPNVTRFFDGESDIYDRDAIDKIEKESIEISSNPLDSSEMEEWGTSKFEISDYPTVATKNSAESQSSIDWPLPIGTSMF